MSPCLRTGECLANRPGMQARLSAGVAAAGDADLERRFGGVRRLHGDVAYARIRRARVAVVGLGGVGSWAVEALARCGVGALVLIDFDHVTESNVNRQIQALTSTLGMAKALALRERIAEIHPGCAVLAIEAFADADNWPGLLGQEPVDAVIDACDQAAAKAAMAKWALATRLPFVAVGAAGGKQQAQRVEIADLAEVTHDPLLASVRRRLRRDGLVRRGAMGLRCVFSREAVAAPVGADACASDGSLNCHGFGSTVVVTATFGMAAAGEALRQIGATR